MRMRERKEGEKEKQAC